MTASPKRRRNRTIVAAIAGVAVLGAAPVLGYSGWNVLKNSTAGKAVEIKDEIAFPSTPTAMLAIVDDQNLVVSLAVMILSPSPGEGLAAVGGTLVSIPTNANRAPTLGDAAVPVADSVINAGVEGLRADVESLTLVTVNSDAVVDAEALAALLTPLGDLSVTLPNDVVTSTADGSTDTLFVAGATSLTPDEAADVLLARTPTQTESRRLPNIRAVWNGMAAAIGAGIEPAAPLGLDVATFDDFMAHFLAGPVQVFNDIETKPLTGSANPDGIDVGSIDVASMVLLMAGLAPSAMITPEPTLNFRIENGLSQDDIDASGLVGLTPADVSRDLIGRLLFLKGNIVSVSSAVYTLESKVAPDTTVVFSPDGLETANLEAITKYVGELDFEALPFTFPLVDVVIVLGRTYLDDMARVREAASSTTSNEPPGDTSDTDGTGDTSPDSSSDITSDATDTTSDATSDATSGT